MVAITARHRTVSIKRIDKGKKIKSKNIERWSFARAD